MGEVRQGARQGPLPHAPVLRLHARAWELEGWGRAGKGEGGAVVEEEGAESVQTWGWGTWVSRGLRGAFGPASPAGPGGQLGVNSFTRAQVKEAQKREVACLGHTACLQQVRDVTRSAWLLVSARDPFLTAWDTLKWHLPWQSSEV